MHLRVLLSCDFSPINSTVNLPGTSWSVAPCMRFSEGLRTQNKDLYLFKNLTFKI